MRDRSRAESAEFLRRVLRNAGSALLALPGVAVLACASDSPLVEASLADPCQAARSGIAPFVGADLARGERRFQTDCAQCHSLSESRQGLPGPHLRGLVSRRIGHSEFHRYSAAFRGREDSWTLGALDQYLEDPQWFIPGTRMNYPGLADPASRLDLIAFLSCETAER